MSGTVVLKQVLNDVAHYWVQSLSLLSLQAVNDSATFLLSLTMSCAVKVND